MFFTLIYRSPSQSNEEQDSFIEKFKYTITLMNKENPCLIVLSGDFNSRSPLLWSGENFENHAGKLMAEFCIRNCFEQLIDEPTHIPNDDTQTCIDLLLTNNTSTIVDSGVIPSPDPSCKHQIIEGKINLHVPPPPRYKRKIWVYKKGNN